MLQNMLNFDMCTNLHIHYNIIYRQSCSMLLPLRTEKLIKHN